MTITVEGVVEKKGFGTGTWALVSAEQTYELKDAPPELQQSGKKAIVQGIIREDVMTLAMIGPVLQVESFQTLS
ncbi:MAG: hypothetical protein P5702_12070 [Limnospira sp. PMC 1291.21]|uniref:Uncharacterized protein n=3 Tax=Limnospira TaxID=2596745 RepID=A0A9P1NYF3_9CYAN|nr:MULTISPECIES: hypothetical protein [Limnospira]EKD05902.1 hypothetical protein SPLC1_S570270 [Arthrospira platensis C1]MDC0838206.1 hypothetical protein [Limnoraphis robusta]MDY7054380.1 hypothetical protein [Limnospira fusiformis LS22]QJB27043.1 hypothetical protein HFV01_16100 [Limnospira fusiformis SAG 85.79]EDZ94649.1 conserved hypothetical protein [Limnospira maxima CS-328]